MFAGMSRPAAFYLSTDELRIETLANRDELHLRRDLTLARIVHLGHWARSLQRWPT